MNRLDAFDIVVRHKNGAVTASIPQLGLYAKAEDVAAALASLEVKKKAFLADLEEAGELDALTEDTRAPVSRHGTMMVTGSSLGQFAIKTCIVATIFVASFAVGGVVIASTIQSSVERTVNKIKSVKIGGGQFWRKLEAEVDRMARLGNDIPEEKKQKLLADIRTIVGRAKPFVAEVQAALAEPSGLRTPAAAPSK